MSKKLIAFLVIAMLLVATVIPVFAKDNSALSNTQKQEFKKIMTEEKAYLKKLREENRELEKQIKEEKSAIKEIYKEKKKALTEEQKAKLKELRAKAKVIVAELKDLMKQKKDLWKKFSEARKVKNLNEATDLFKQITDVKEKIKTKLSELLEINKEVKSILG